jgi:uncharacterized protein (DUF433 family)
MKQHILQLLADKESDTNTLLKHFPAHRKQDVLELLRTLLDEDRITRTDSGFQAV